MTHNASSYRKGMQMMETIVRVRGRPGKWWLRPLQGADRVMVIPIKNSIPIVHLFEITTKSEIIHEQEEPGRSG